MHEEKLSFVVTLSGTFWDKRPQFSVWLDQKQIVSSEIADESQQEVRFEQEVNEGPHALIIRLENKTSDQTVLNLGWNGSYTLNFSSPFYIWLLEKL